MAINVQSLDRDLSFHPVVNPSPRTLSAEQVKGFNERGYVMPLDVLSSGEADDLRRYFDDMMARVLELGGDSYSINGYHNRSARLYDLTLTPRILDYVEDLLGPDFLVWGTHFFCKTPHDPKEVPWHQDASYWPLTPSKTVTVWLAIDDVDRGNSAMRFIAGSHRQGHLAFETRSDNVVLNQQVVNAESMGETIDVELKAGQISLHSDMLVHGSLPNASDRRRCGLTIRYASTEVRPLAEGWGQASILCRGADRFGHWRFINRPEGEDYSLPAWGR